MDHGGGCIFYHNPTHYEIVMDKAKIEESVTERWTTATKKAHHMTLFATTYIHENIHALDTMTGRDEDEDYVELREWIEYEKLHGKVSPDHRYRYDYERDGKPSCLVNE